MTVTAGTMMYRIVGLLTTPLPVSSSKEDNKNQEKVVKKHEQPKTLIMIIIIIICKVPNALEIKCSKCTCEETKKRSY